MNIRGQEITLEPSGLEQVIQARLTGGPTNLPAAAPEEDPVDIFVDLAELDKSWKDQLRTAVAKLLSAQVKEYKPEESSKTTFLGELCYLAARIGSTEALEPLKVLVGNIRATGLVSPGEDLRLRALRSYVGLLGASANPQGVVDAKLLTNSLTEPRLAMVALVGLIGIWPDQAEEYLKQFPADAQHGELLELSINLAFPSKNPLRRSR